MSDTMDVHDEAQCQHEVLHSNRGIKNQRTGSEGPGKPLEGV